MIQWQPARSDALSEIGYDSERQVVAVKFKGSTKPYETGGVTQAQFDEFVNAPSQQQFWRENFKP